MICDRSAIGALFVVFSQTTPTCDRRDLLEAPKDLALSGIQEMMLMRVRANHVLRRDGRGGCVKYIDIQCEGMRNGVVSIRMIYRIRLRDRG